MTSQSTENAELLARLDEYARSRYSQYFPESALRQEAERGRVEVDYWSISYRLTVGDRPVFIKIPKADMYQADIESIIRDPRARLSAETEFGGFRDIYGIDDWPEGCAAVRPLEFVPAFNAIVTQFVPSEDLFRRCRRAAVRGIIRRTPLSRGVHDALRRCGDWLRHFQRSSDGRGAATIRSSQLLGDIKRWAGEIEQATACRGRLARVVERLERSAWVRVMPQVRCCEGFEVRNIIVDGDGTVRLVDPGLVGWGSGLQDVAHFLVSVTMLYWGTSALWFGVAASGGYRQSFLEAWCGTGGPAEPEVLAWFEIREWFRQWAEAHRVVARKPYPKALRRVLGAVYVDTFFLNRISHTAAGAEDYGL